jgi:hypothetical protein
MNRFERVSVGIDETKEKKLFNDLYSISVILYFLLYQLAKRQHISL